MALLASGVIMGLAAGPAAKSAHADICADKAAADRVANYAYHHNWSPPPNHRGGSRFYNRDGKLPSSPYYKEYYVYPTSQHRPQRVVINVKTTGYWFSPDHYRTFDYMGRLNDEWGGGCF
jgi:guanyl-specific ribonuclease Sa